MRKGSATVFLENNFLCLSNNRIYVKFWCLFSYPKYDSIRFCRKLYLLLLLSDLIMVSLEWSLLNGLLTTKLEEKGNISFSSQSNSRFRTLRTEIEII